MPHRHFATYLNDHLAGSITAIEILGHIVRAKHSDEITQSASALAGDITEDRQELEDLIARLKFTQSIPRKTAGWLMEKATELKLHVDDLSGGCLRLLEEFETVAIGIDGKMALWKSLAAIAEHFPEVQQMDLNRLISRAQEQRQRCEGMRLSAAKRALISA